MGHWGLRLIRLPRSCYRIVQPNMSVQGIATEETEQAGQMAVVADIFYCRAGDTEPFDGSSIATERPVPPIGFKPPRSTHIANKGLLGGPIGAVLA